MKDAYYNDLGSLEMKNIQPQSMKDLKILSKLMVSERKVLMTHSFSGTHTSWVSSEDPAYTQI